MSVSGFVMGRLLAQNAGISDTQRANTYGLASAFVGSSLPGLLVVRQVAASEAASAPAPSTSPTLPVPPGATLPDAPGNVIAVAGEQQATVPWEAPNDGGSPILNYVVTTFSGTAPQSGLYFRNSVSEATIPGLQDGTAYTFQVVAVNAIGSSQPGISAEVTPGGLPDAPTGIVVDRSDGTITVKWVPPKYTGTSKIKGFNIVVLSGTRIVRTTTAKGSDTSAAIDKLEAGANYTIAVSAVNDSGEGQSGSASAPGQQLKATTVMSPMTSTVGGTQPAQPPASGPNGGAIQQAVKQLEGDIIKVRDELRESTRELRRAIDAGFSNVLQTNKPPAPTSGAKK